MPSVLTICPSWQRGGGIDGIVESWENTTNGGELLIALDSCDPTLDKYLSHLPSWVTLHIGPRMKMAHKVNRVFQDYPDQDYYVFVGDDHRFRTPDWDLKLIEAIGPGYGIAYGDDLHQGKNLPTAFMISNAFPMALGYIFHPSLDHLYVDNWIMDLGKMYRTLNYVPEVIIEHMHPHVFKSEMDASYRESNSAGQYIKDKQAFDAIDWSEVHEKVNDFIYPR